MVSGELGVGNYTKIIGNL